MLDPKTLTRRAAMGGGIAAIAAVAGCAEPAHPLIEEMRPLNRRVGALIDMSGSYRSNRDGLANELVAISRRLGGGDEFAVQFMAACSYDERFAPPHLRWRLTPSRLGALTELQEIQGYLSEQFDLPTLPPADTGYTDIRGALQLALEHQRQSGLALGVLFLFSDLKITLQPGCATAAQPLQDMTGVTVVGVNIARGPEDTQDRELYRQNILTFQREVEHASGHFEEAQSAGAVLDRVLPRTA